MSFNRTGTFYLKAVGGVLFVASLVGGYLAFATTPELQEMLRPEAVRDLIAVLGLAGLVWMGWKLKGSRSGVR